jgi:signal transduction histidine kinase
MCVQLDDANRQLAVATDARIAALEQLRHADRLKTVGQLASGVAHELGTPLNVVSGRANMIARGMVEGDAVTDSARIIAEQAARIAAIIRQLLDFSRRRGPSLGPVDLRPIAARTIELLGTLARKRSVTLAVESPAAALSARVDPGQIQQVLTNLVVNGLQAMPEGGTLTIRLDRRHATPPADVGGPSGEFATVTVEDHGAGIAPENLPRVFEPFFTTKEVGEGTGLGLSVAYGIVREHGGWIDVQSVPGQRTRFTVFLQQAPDAPVREALA